MLKNAVKLCSYDVISQPKKKPILNDSVARLYLPIFEIELIIY